MTDGQAEEKNSERGRVVTKGKEDIMREAFSKFAPGEGASGNSEKIAPELTLLRKSRRR